MSKVAENRAKELLECLKRGRGFSYDALYWVAKLEDSHTDHSYYDHAVSVAALKEIEKHRALLETLETNLQHLQSKATK